jgi:ABC-type nitrate/sulfonate/bicarbonate transport system ATPase subunit
MDEPFVSLDENAARELRSLFLDLWIAECVTTLFVTHNVAEAAELATRVLVFGASPATIVADLEMPARIEGGSVCIAKQRLHAVLEGSAKPSR